MPWKPIPKHPLENGELLLHAASKSSAGMCWRSCAGRWRGSTASGQSPTAIGRDLGISSRDVQAFLPREKSARVRIGLPERAITALIHGRYAGFGGETDAARVRNIVQIAVCYTRDELLSEPGVGIVTALRIEQWLEGRGLPAKELAFVPRNLGRCRRTEPYVDLTNGRADLGNRPACETVDHVGWCGSWHAHRDSSE